MGWPGPLLDSSTYEKACPYFWTSPAHIPVQRISEPRFSPQTITPYDVSFLEEAISPNFLSAPPSLLGVLTSSSGNSEFLLANEITGGYIELDPPDSDEHLGWIRDLGN